VAQDYQGLFPDEQLRPGPTPAAPAGGKGLFPPPSTSDPLSRTVDQARQVQPDRATREFQLRLRTGLPPALVSQNFEELERETARSDFDPEQFRKSWPKLAAWLQGDVAAAAASAKDLPALQDVDLQLRFGLALMRGWNGLQSSTGRFVEFAGEATGLESVRRYGQAVARKNNEDARLYDAPALRGPWELHKWLVDTVGEQLPIMAPIMAGGAAGAAVGSVVPGVGTVIGGLVGAFVPSFVLNTGDVQETLKELGGEDTQAPLAVFVGGSAVAAFDSVLPGAIGSRLVKTFGFDTAERIARRALAAPVKSSFLRRTARGTVTGMATEGVTEAIQESIAMEAAAIGAATSTPEDYRSRVAQAGAAGAVMGGMFQGGTAAITHRRQQQLALQAEQQKAFFDDLAKGVEQSELAKTAPTVFEQFVAAQTNGTPLESVYVPAKEFQEYFQQKGLPADAIAQELTGSATALEDALRTGTDLVIPTPVYASRLANTEHHKGLADVLRLDPKSYNLRETKELLQAAAAVAEQDVDAQEAAFTSGTEAVRTRVVEQALAAGATDTVANTWADYYAARYTERARLLGVTPEQLLAVRPPPAIVSDFVSAPDTPTPGIPASRPERNETADLRARRRETHFAALESAVIRDAQALDPTVDPDFIRRELQFRLSYEEERQAAAREAGTGQDLLRAIAERGGVWDDGDLAGEVRHYAVEGRDKRGARDRGTAHTWNGVAGVFKEGGQKPDDIVTSLRQDERFAYIEDVNDLFDAVDQALRAAQDVDAFPGTDELRALGIAPGERWWGDSWRNQENLDSEEGDVSFNPAEFEQRVTSRLEEAEAFLKAQQQFEALEPSKSIPAGVRPPFPIVSNEEATQLFFAAGGTSARGEVRSIPIASIIATQDWLFPGRAAEYASGERVAGGRPIALHLNGRFYLSDGHHRAAAAWLKGDTEIEAEVREVNLERLADMEGKEPTEFFQRAGGIPTGLEKAVSMQTVLPLAQKGTFENRRDLKTFLQQHVRAAARAHGVRDLDPAQPRVRDYLVNVATREALSAIKEHANAVGWYDTKVRQAMAVMALLHPELETNQNAAFAFKYALAVTSNGLKVGTNFVLAERAYATWKASGTMPAIGEGKAAAQINQALEEFNRAVGERGLEGYQKFLTSEFTVRELGQMGHPITGEVADLRVRGAAVLGPKIGNGFFSNLMGFFDNLTMDRWFVRTWQRWLGGLIEKSPALIAGARSDVRGAIARLGAREREFFEDVTGRTLEGKLSDYAVDRIGEAIRKASEEPDVRARMARTRAGDDLRRGGIRLSVNLQGERESPRNKTERVYMREVMQRTLGELTDRGYNLTLADLQALLWYPEKRLYEAATASEEINAAYAHNEAPDYANAAASLARLRDIPEVDIATALERAGRPAAGRAGGARRSGARAQRQAPLPVKAKAARASARRARVEFNQRDARLTDEQLQDFADEVLNDTPDLTAFDLRLDRRGSIYLEVLAVASDALHGTGTRAMERLLAFADAHGARIEISLPDPGFQPTSDSKKTSSEARLRKFYKRFGFIDNKGRNKRFDLSMYTMMYRDPQGEFRQPDGWDSIDGGGDPGAGIRGGFNPSTNTIRLVAGAADLSTFLHESGHAFLEELVTDALNPLDTTAPEAAAQLRADAETVMRWVGFHGTLEEWAALPINARRSHHEQFARGFEAYLMEGKAPTPELQTLYSRFRSWLVAVYRTLKRLRTVAGADWAEVAPEVRAVMDRLVAADAAIEAAIFEQDVQPLFTDAATAGVTREQFEQYRERIAEAHRAAVASVDRRVMADWRREQQAWWKEERDVVQAAVLEEFDGNPAFVAQSVIRTGKLPSGRFHPSFIDGRPVKLSKDDIVRQWGQERLRRLPRPYLYTREGGLGVDVVAELLGFSSGDAMLNALERSPRWEHVLEQETDDRMRQKHGDLLLEGLELNEVAEAAVADQRAAVISAELEALTAGLQERIPPPTAMRMAAEARLRQAKVRDIKPGLFLQAASRASRQAFSAFAKNDRAGAVAAKQQELAALSLYRVARDAKERVTSRRKALQKYDTHGPTRARLAKAGEGYLDRIDELLARYEFTKRPLKDIDRRDSLRTWVERQKADGLPFQLPEAVLEQLHDVNYQELTLEEFDGVYDSVEQIAHMARFKNKLLKARDARELREVRLEIAQSILSSVKRRPRVLEPRHASEKAFRYVEARLASHRKLASIVRELDGFQDGGPMWDFVMRRINEAADEEATRFAGATRSLAAIFDKHFDPMAVARIGQKLEVPAINGSLSHEARLAVALNWGNETNRARLKAGYGWSDQQVQAILDTLSKRDWDFVQDVWNYIDSFWLEIEAKERRVVGLPPEKVEATPVFTRFGEYRGGYYPIAFEGEASARVEALEEMSMAKMLAAAAYTHQSTARGHVERRADKDANITHEVRLDFGVIYKHVNQVLHDLTHHEMLIDVGRILDPNHEVAEAIQETLGPAFYRQFKTALAAIAVGDAPSVHEGETTLAYLRTGTTVVGLGLSVTTMMMQPLGLTQSIRRIGAVPVARGLKQWLTSAKGREHSMAWVYERSPMMAARGRTFMRELNELRNKVGADRGFVESYFDGALRSVTGDHLTRQSILSSFFAGIAKFQQFADMPTWLGAYEKALEDPTNRKDNGTVDEERAARLADQAVLDAQGGGQVKDLAAIQRGGPAWKLWTTFYSFFNTTYNQLAESYRENVKGTPVHPAKVGMYAVDFLLLVTVPATLGELLKDALRGDLGDDLEDPAAFAERVARANLSYLAGTMVLVRELGGVIQGYGNYEGPAGARGVASISRLATQVNQGEWDEALMRSLNTSAGILLHYPAAQVERTVRGIKALADGTTSNPLAVLVGPPREE
jgi:hypothetical protein